MGSGRADPLFRFGEGLSYTNFTFTNLIIKASGVASPVPVQVSVDVSNVGKVTGCAVVQVYVEDPIMAFVRPWKRLVAFARITVVPGSKATVTLDLTADELSFYDDDMKWRVVPGNYTVSAGGDSYSAAYLTAPLILE